MLLALSMDPCRSLSLFADLNLRQGGEAFLRAPSLFVQEFFYPFVRGFLRENDRDRLGWEAFF